MLYTLGTYSLFWQPIFSWSDIRCAITTTAQSHVSSTNYFNFIIIWTNDQIIISYSTDSDTISEFVLRILRLLLLKIKILLRPMKKKYFENIFSNNFYNSKDLWNFQCFLVSVSTLILFRWFDKEKQLKTFKKQSFKPRCLFDHRYYLWKSSDLWKC